ncbi:MAG: hypothetical protein WCG99_03990 [Candidatus Berkelbacteria bacterium]
MWYLAFCIMSLVAAPYFWSWGTIRAIGWSIWLSAMGAAYLGGLQLDTHTAIACAYIAGLFILAIGVLARTLYDQIHHPAPVLSF